MKTSRFKTKFEVMSDVAWIAQYVDAELAYSKSLDIKPEVINRVAVISLGEIGEALDPITSYENVTTIAIWHVGTNIYNYNAHHRINLSTAPRFGFDGYPDFYLISNPENATREIEQLEKTLIGVDLVIVLVELSEYSRLRETFTLLVFIKQIQMQCSKILCVAKEPFYFEGRRRGENSELCLEKLFVQNIPVVVLDANKILIAVPNVVGMRGHFATINSVVSTVTCDLIERLRQEEGWEAFTKIIQGSSDSKIYFDITKKAMKPQSQFIYTLFGRCNAPALIESKPIVINIPIKK